MKAKLQPANSKARALLKKLQALAERGIDGERAAALHVHPYTLALDLGRQIRFSVPLEHIAAELEMATRKCLTPANEGPHPRS